MLTEATLRKTRYFPEILPGTSVVNLTTLSQVSSALDLRRFSGLDVKLLAVASKGSDANIEVRIVRDDDELVVRPDAYGVTYAYPADFDLWAKEYLGIRVATATGATMPAGYSTTAYSLFVGKPTVARKILLGLPLDPMESAIDKELGISKSVEKGVLPLPLSYTLEREYQVLKKASVSRVVGVGGGTSASYVETARAGSALILGNIWLQRDMPAENTLLVIDRDGDSGYVELHAAAMPYPSPLKCWIPALRELRLTLTSQVPEIKSVSLSYEVMEVKLTNLIKARWGLAREADVPPETWAKVWGGVL